MKKIFVDIYLAFNLGDDLFLDILANRYPDSEITVNYVGDRYDEFIKKYNNLKRRKYTIFNKVTQKLKIKEYLKDYKRIAEEYDALIFIGGSIFREESYYRELYKERINMIENFKERNKPIFILGANFGPYESKEFLEKHVKLFKLCDDVCFRDKYSYKLFENIESVRYAKDIVFSMEEKPKVDNKENRVGYSIIDPKHKQGLRTYYNQYIDTTAKSVEKMVKKGYKCVLMSFCEEEGDMKVIQEIILRINQKYKEEVEIYEYKGDLEEALDIIRNLKLMIGARFHANILAMVFKIGLLPVIYSDKTLNMLKDLDNGEIVIKMNELNNQTNDYILERAINNSINLQEKNIDSDKQFKNLDRFLL